MAVFLENSHHPERPIVQVPCYFPFEGALPPPTWQELVDFCRQGNYDLVMGCDAKTHHMGWGSSNENRRGQLLAEFLATCTVLVQHW